MTKIGRTMLVAAAFSASGCDRAAVPATESAVDSARGTLLEAFATRYGEVVVMGMQDVARIPLQYRDSVLIEAREIKSPADTQVAFGLVIRLHDEYGRQRESAFVDYDEITELVRALDYVARLDSTVTRLAEFQGDYRTRGDFRVSSHGATRTLGFGLEAGRGLTARVYPTEEQFARFRAALLEGRQILETAGARASSVDTVAAGGGR